ncbi:MAG: signal peptidase I [Clostridia bacterium]|nr:signal peptidase I [Clostridia bacterium]
MSSTPVNEKTKRSKAGRAAGIIFNVVLWIFLIFALIMMIFAFASNSNKYGVSILGDKVILYVKTDSMEPTIKTGDMIVGTVISDEEKKALKAKSADYDGDIITFFADLDGDGEKEPNTHRIIEIEIDDEEYIFHTKGDNPNATADDYSIRLDDIICTWNEGDTQIHGLGTFLEFLQGRTGFLLVVILPLVALLIYEIVRLVVLIVRLKSKDKRAEISDAEKEEIRRLAIEEYKRSMSGEGTEVPQDKGE